MSLLDPQQLVEQARALIEGGQAKEAHARLGQAAQQVATAQGEVRGALLEVAVEAAERAGALPVAVEHQRTFIALVETTGEAYEIAAEFERLGDLLLATADTPTGFDALEDAEQAYISAHKRYVESDGPSTTDAVDALRGMFRVARAAHDPDRMVRRATAMVDATDGLVEGKRAKAKVADLLEDTASHCEDFGIVELTERLRCRAAELMGVPYTPPAAPVAPPSAEGGLASLFGGDDFGAEQDDEDEDAGGDEDFGIDALLRAVSGGSKQASSSGPWKRRCERLLDLLERAQSDSDLRMDAPRRIAALGELPQQYVALVFEKGVVSDRDAAQALGVGSSELEAAMPKVVALLDDLL